MKDTRTTSLIKSNRITSPTSKQCGLTQSLTIYLHLINWSLIKKKCQILQYLSQN